MSTPVSYQIFKELKSYGMENGIRYQEDGQTKLQNIKLSQELPLNDTFRADLSLETFLLRKDCHIIKDASGVSVYPNVTVHPKEYYQSPANYYHDVLSKFCQQEVLKDAPKEIMEARASFTEITGELPTIANLNREMITGLKSGNERVPMESINTMLTESYKDVVRSEIAAIATLKANGYEPDETNMKYAASAVMRAERALERQGITVQSVNELRTFEQADKTIARVNEVGEKHQIVEKAKETGIETFKGSDGRTHGKDHEC